MQAFKFSGIFSVRQLRAGILFCEGRVDRTAGGSRPAGLRALVAEAGERRQRRLRWVTGTQTTGSSRARARPTGGTGRRGNGGERRYAPAAARHGRPPGPHPPASGGVRKRKASASRGAERSPSPTAGRRPCPAEWLELPASVKLIIVQGENNFQKLILQNGLPATFPEHVEHIKQCGVQSDFRVQFMDADFDNEFTNLTSISEIVDKSTIKLIFDSGQISDTPTPLTQLLLHLAVVKTHHFQVAQLTKTFCHLLILQPQDRLDGLLFLLFPDSRMIVSCSWKKPMPHSKQLQLCSTLTSDLKLLFLTV
ncbi:uncharacterized protein LOC118565517 [Fundulus heteroclitus]|uniref:uncharacterized protein LOC118565517 n=1 Tax=Fundulus heteroclitus TaxID=8078 RepID=UPI00165B8EE4|nr:uncharacterized protein LOC118565517 [Fundulus heteroclitus]XP_036001828.1 uncharacterized protein LOC118565517 [Fundulus heteroclitus]XP_036001829.1 uncharacterized protein LOC118565517 [Fundulus heteroclitus]